AQAAEQGWPALHAELRRVDPESAAKIRPGDRQRIQRALEVHALTGRPMSALSGARRGGLSEPLVRIALMPGDRASLGERIEARLDAMLEAGLVDEVKALHDLPGMHAGLPAR